MLSSRLNLCHIVKPIVIKNAFTNNLSTSSRNNYKVAVIGAAGGIGQPMSLLLKLDPLVTKLTLYDIAKVTPGVAKDLSHINTKCRVKGYQGDDALATALKGAHVVVIPAGVPRKPGMSRDDLFNTNASIVFNSAVSIAKECPEAILAIITNPVNSVVPIAAETLKKAGVFDPCKVMGVTTLDIVRSSTFIGEINCCDPACVDIPVIGGHAGATIIPVFSQCRPPVNLQDQEQIEKLTKRIQEAGTEVVKAKAGGGSATLSMAFAAARIISSILKGLKGEKGIIECAYVNSNVTKAGFFSNPLVLGTKGVEQNLGYGNINEYEKKLLDAAVPILIKNINKGIDFVQKQDGGKQGSTSRCQ